MFILLVGSPAFGLEALLIGRERILRGGMVELIKIVVPLGLIIVSSALVVSYYLTLGPLYQCTLILALVVFSGGLLSLGSGEGRYREDIPSGEAVSDGDIKSMLRKRGLDELMEDREDVGED